MRGISASGAVAVVIIIILIVVGGYFLLQYSSGGGKIVISYKNDIITVENLYISNLKPYEGTDTDIEFLVSNNGDRPAGNVIVTFESTAGGFGLIGQNDLRCGGGELQKTDIPAISKSEWNKCFFKEIDSLDVKPIHLTLHAKTVLTDTTYDIKYSVSYDYTGSRLATVPIIDRDTRSQPISKFSQSTPSYGPVVLEFQAGEPREFTEGGKKLTGYWLELGGTAEVKISLKNIGSSSVGTINDTYINTATFTIDTKGSLTPDGLCYFGEKPTKKDGLLYYCRNIDQGSQECDFNSPLRPVKLPAQLSCIFTPSKQITDSKIPEVSGTILANFGYTYKFVKSFQLTIKNVNG